MNKSKRNESKRKRLSGLIAELVVELEAQPQDSRNDVVRKFIRQTEPQRFTVQDVILLKSLRAEKLESLLFYEKIIVVLNGQNFESFINNLYHVFWGMTESRLARTIAFREFLDSERIRRVAASNGEEMKLSDLLRGVDAACAGDEKAAQKLLTKMSEATANKLIEGLIALEKDSKRRCPRGNAAVHVDDLYPLIKPFLTAEPRCSPSLEDLLPLLHVLRSSSGVIAIGQSHTSAWVQFGELILEPFFANNPAVSAWMT